MKKLALSMVISCCLALEGNAQELWNLDTKAVIPPYEEAKPMPTAARFEGGISVNGSDFTNQYGELISEILPTALDVLPAGTYNSAFYEMKPGDTANILFRLYPDPAHLGQVADIAVMVAYVDITSVVTTIDDNLLGSVVGKDETGTLSVFADSPSDLDFLKPWYFTLDSQNALLPLPENWQAGDLAVYQQVTLQEVHELPLYNDPLEAAGMLEIICFYRLQDGTLVYNQTPVSALVWNSSIVDSILGTFF